MEPCGKIAKLVEILAPHYGRDCPAAAVYHASWPDQKVVRATLADVAARTEAEGITRTAILLVGRARLPARWQPSAGLLSEAVGGIWGEFHLTNGRNESSIPL